MASGYLSNLSYLSSLSDLSLSAYHLSCGSVTSSIFSMPCHIVPVTCAPPTTMQRPRCTPRLLRNACPPDPLLLEGLHSSSSRSPLCGTRYHSILRIFPVSPLLLDRPLYVVQLCPLTWHKQT